MTMIWKCAHPQAFQDVWKFVASSDFEKHIIVSHFKFYPHVCLELFWAVQISLLIQTKLLEGSVIMDYGLTGRPFLLWISFFTNTHLDCGLLGCFYQLFGLSFWRHPFTTEDPLVSKWCNATFLQIWWRNKLIYILDDLRVKTFSAHFPI